MKPITDTAATPRNPKAPHKDNRTETIVSKNELRVITSNVVISILLWRAEGMPGDIEKATNRKLKICAFSRHKNRPNPLFL